MKSKKDIFEFLNQQAHAVVSTVNKQGNPQAALVGFGQTTDLQIIFGTDMTTRKAQNLSHNTHVAMVINGDDSCVQLEGIAKQTSGEELKKYFDLFFKKMPGLEKYSHLKNQIYFVVTPNWIRYIDHTTSPGTVSEMRF